MTNAEFSNEFDILLNSYSGNTPLTFDEYEKSIFLTRAQEQLVESLYTGRAIGDSFEDTEQLRRYLAELVKTIQLEVYEGSDNQLSSNSYYAVIPDDVWFITYESAVLNKADDKCLNNKEVQVVPVTQDEYHRIKDNPFRRANSRRVLRLDNNSNTVELISKYKLKNYLIRYIAIPTPIVLVGLPDGLYISTINNKDTYKYNMPTECKLHPSLHRMILELAVSMAIKSKANSQNK